MSGPPRQPHLFTYAVTVEDQGRTHTVRVSEDDMPESLSSLISWMSSVEAAKNGSSRPASSREEWRGSPG